VTVPAGLKAFWERGEPLVFLAVWTAATAASIAWVSLVPGRPEYRYDGQLQAAVLGGVLVLFFLYRGSSNARRLGLFAALFGVLAGAFGAFAPGGSALEAKFIGLAALQALAFAALLSPPLERYVSVNRPRRLGRWRER
jgi:hypothetical protein